MAEQSEPTLFQCRANDHVVAPTFKQRWADV